MPDPTFPPSPLTTRTRLTRLGISWLLVGIGVSLLLRADLGVSPFDVLNTGAVEAFGVSFAFWYVINATLCFVVGGLLGNRFGWASVVGTVVIGMLIEVVMAVLPDVDRLVVRGALLVAGVLSIGTAVCFAVTAEYGVGPTEAVMLGLMHHGLGVVPSRLISDGTPLVIGALLGGAVGVGTAVFALSMGPIIRWGLRHLRYVPPSQRIAPITIGG